MNVHPGNAISPTFCTVPWVHLAFEPDGKVIPCCMTSETGYTAGDVNTMTLEEIWNSDNMKLLRKQMLEGVQPKPCRKCFDKEIVTPDHSNRVYANQIFESKIPEVKEITAEDGTCSKIDLKYWDFRFSNKCNFRCRSCGPTYSSAWVEDAKELFHDGINPGPEKDFNKLWTTSKVRKTDNVEGESRYEFLKKHTKEVQKIYFAGGEPLIMDEHYYILDMLLEQGRTDVYICYNTNTSNLTYKGKNVIDYWKKWNPDKISIWPSIDEIGPRAELIRKGTIWSDVEDNLKQMAKLDIEIRPGLTISAFNVFRLPEILDHLMSLNVIQEKRKLENWFINLLEYPRHYHVTILSDKFKEEITAKIKNYIEQIKTAHNIDLSEKFIYILHQLSLPHDPKQRKIFVDITAKLDKIRNENTYEVIPEMRDCLNETVTVAPVQAKVVYSWTQCTCGQSKSQDGSCDGSHNN